MAVIAAPDEAQLSACIGRIGFGLPAVEFLNDAGLTTISDLLALGDRLLIELIPHASKFKLKQSDETPPFSLTSRS